MRATRNAIPNVSSSARVVAPRGRAGNEHVDQQAADEPDQQPVLDAHDEHRDRAADENEICRRARQWQLSEDGGLDNRRDERGKRGKR